MLDTTRVLVNYSTSADYKTVRFQLSKKHLKTDVIKNNKISDCFFIVKVYSVTVTNAAK